jgi:hypothetical protein
VYVEITNFELSPTAANYASPIANVNGTYALDRKAGNCNLWVGPDFGDACIASDLLEESYVETGPLESRSKTFDAAITIRTSYVLFGNRKCFNPVTLPILQETLPEICGSGVIASGSSNGLAIIYRETFTGYTFAENAGCTFDWKVSA